MKCKFIGTLLSRRILKLMCFFSNGMGTTIFFSLATPKSGGDTLYLSTTAAYDNLSEDYRQRLHGLYATHSAFDQAKVADHIERYIRKPIETVHPVVRTHPVSFSVFISIGRSTVLWLRRF
jgi:sulfonate dioxygenase